MLVVRIRETGNALAITIPRPYLKQLNWGLGENLVLEIVEHTLSIRALREHFPPAVRLAPKATEPYSAAP